MIILCGDMTMNPDVIDAMEKDIAELRPQVLEEEGCLHYSLLVEDAKAGIVNVLERWTSDEALVKHLQQPWTAEFFGKYGPEMRGSTLRIYDVSGDRPLPEM